MAAYSKPFVRREYRFLLALIAAGLACSRDDSGASASPADAADQGDAADVRNNLTRVITTRTEGEATIEANLQDVAATTFADADAGDFHLVAGTDAEDAGVAVDDAGLDLDGQTHDRGSAPDIGADER